jgi:hypothetical protein
VQHQELASHDYTGGAGLQSLRELVATGATFVDSVGAAVELTKKYIAANRAKMG